MCKLSLVMSSHSVLYSPKFTHSENDRFLSTLNDIKLNEGENYKLVIEVLIGPSFTDLRYIDKCSLGEITTIFTLFNTLGIN